MTTHELGVGLGFNPDGIDNRNMATIHFPLQRSMTRTEAEQYAYLGVTGHWPQDTATVNQRRRGRSAPVDEGVSWVAARAELDRLIRGGQIITDGERYQRVIVGSEQKVHVVTPEGDWDSGIPQSEIAEYLAAHKRDLPKDPTLRKIAIMERDLAALKNQTESH